VPEPDAPVRSAPTPEQLRAIRLVVFDFDGVLTDNTVIVSQDGQESVRCWRSDGLGLQRVTRLGIACMILSTETNPVVSARAAKLRLPCRQGESDKAAALREIMTERGVAPEQTAYMGNDVNDADCFRLVGLPIAVADAHPDILPLVVHRTVAPGGRGAVREFCDLLAGAHGG
jgi:3-deoxy-D-manno-octulosonate 8-phosphate phosphatase (KDO 8-P phosphatase)